MLLLGFGIGYNKDSDLRVFISFLVKGIGKGD